MFVQVSVPCTLLNTSESIEKIPNLLIVIRQYIMYVNLVPRGNEMLRQNALGNASA